MLFRVFLVFPLCVIVAGQCGGEGQGGKTGGSHCPHSHTPHSHTPHNPHGHQPHSHTNSPTPTLPTLPTAFPTLPPSPTSPTTSPTSTPTSAPTPAPEFLETGFGKVVTYGGITIVSFGFIVLFLWIGKKKATGLLQIFSTSVFDGIFRCFGCLGKGIVLALTGAPHPSGDPEFGTGTSLCITTLHQSVKT